MHLDYVLGIVTANVTSHDFSFAPHLLLNCTTTGGLRAPQLWLVLRPHVHHTSQIPLSLKKLFKKLLKIGWLWRFDWNTQEKDSNVKVCVGEFVSGNFQELEVYSEEIWNLAELVRFYF